LESVLALKLNNTFDIPFSPDVPDVPELPDEPDLPEEPEEPAVPDDPDLPEEPDVPELPEEPDVPELPEVPFIPPKKVSFNTLKVSVSALLFIIIYEPSVSPMNSGNSLILIFAILFIL
jgi:hypothetical protein